MTTNRLLSDTVGALAGIAFAVLLLFSFASVNPLFGATDQELVDWWNTDSNVSATLLSAFFILAAAPCFLLFLSSLRSRLSEAEGGTAPLTAFAAALGICFVVLMLFGGAARGLVAHSVKIGDEPLPGPDTLRYVTALSVVTFGTMAVPMASLLVGATGWISFRTKAFAAWVGWVSLLVAPVTLALAVGGLGGIASPLIQLWAVAISVQLWRTRSRAT